MRVTAGGMARQGSEKIELLKNVCVLVILLTAYSKEFNWETAVAMGAWEYLEKPFVVDEIRELVRAALAANGAANGMCA